MPAKASARTWFINCENVSAEIFSPARSNFTASGTPPSRAPTLSFFSAPATAHTTSSESELVSKLALTTEPVSAPAPPSAPAQAQAQPAQAAPAQAQNGYQQAQAIKSSLNKLYNVDQVVYNDLVKSLQQKPVKTDEPPAVAMTGNEKPNQVGGPSFTDVATNQAKPAVTESAKRAERIAKLSLR